MPYTAELSRLAEACLLTLLVPRAGHRPPRAAVASADAWRFHARRLCRSAAPARLLDNVRCQAAGRPDDSRRRGAVERAATAGVHPYCRVARPKTRGADDGDDEGARRRLSSCSKSGMRCATFGVTGLPSSHGPRGWPDTPAHSRTWAGSALDGGRRSPERRVPIKRWWCKAGAEAHTAAKHAPARHDGTSPSRGNPTPCGGGTFDRT